ncbi:SpaA isopeptide-forming pilin-related protein [Streptomyces sp. NPDC001941]|uniref:DUF7927 domain-containing protein n=1 Tax=Streptomyces sp. NPDC001941 TaxID=3154659 RepID=UPI003316ED1A
MAAPPPARSRRAWRVLLTQVLSTTLTVPALLMTTATPAAAASWTVEGERDPSTFDCDHLYYSNFRSGMQFRNGANGDAVIQNEVITKRNPPAAGPPDYWSTSMAMGMDPDTGRPAAFYANYTTASLKLYKHVSGTNTVTDEIAGGEQRNLPAGTNWGGLTMDPTRGLLYGAQNGSTPKIFQMDLKTGATKIWERPATLKPVPANDATFNSGTLVPDLFVDDKGGVYFGIQNSGTHVYRLDPGTGTVEKSVTVTGPADNGFNNYGMAWHNGAIYMGRYDGYVYKVDPRTGASTTLAGGTAQGNQAGTVQSEGGGTWPITDLASCDIAPNLNAKVELKKTATPANAKPGEKVTYRLVVKNTGTGRATGVKVDDDLTDVVDDATYGNDARATSSASGTSPPAPTYDATTKKLSWTGDLAPGETVTLTYTATVNSPPGGNKVLRNAATSEDSNCEPGSTDPDCKTVTPVATLKIKKSSTPGDPKPGDTVTYTVTYTNDGEADWKGASMVDDLTSVVDDATYNADARATSSTGGTVPRPTYDAATKKLSWTGDVAKGTTVTITYTVRVNKPPTGDHRLSNAVVGPPGSNCPPGSTDPDCTNVTPLPNLEIKKVADKASAKPGEKITYTLTVKNTGSADYKGAKVEDDLTGVLDDARFNDDASPATAVFDAGAKKLTWTGDVAKGATVTITYSVTVNKLPTGDKQLKNAVTGPDDSTCVDDCETVTPIAALEIKKSSAPANAKPGDKVTYTITVKNTGTADYANARVVDDLAGVLDDARFNNDASPATAVFDAASKKLTWTGTVAKGATVTITYSVTVNKPPTGDKQLRNAVTGPDDSTCADDCETVTPVAVLEIKKSSAPANAKPGDKVTYTITVKNTGTADYKGAKVEDDLTGVLDDARFNDDASPATAVFDAGAKKLTWTGDVAKGATVTITYSVTVNKPPTGDKQLKNKVVGPDDSTCVDDCETVTPLAALEIKKVADKASAKPGEKITYTLTVKNTGSADYKGAKVEDDLTGVLDDARFNNDASPATAVFDAGSKKLTWTGTVAKGATVTVTYSVTVNKPPTGDKQLKNAVTGPDDSTCADDCETVTPIAALEIKKSSAPANAKPGDKVTYTITVKNTGTADYANARVVDDLAGVLDDARFNNDASPAAAVFDAASKKLTWTGNVAKGATVTITYSVTVSKPPTGDKQLKNKVVGPDDSTCVDDCETVTPISGLEIKKAADKANAKPGEKITYTLTVRNTGTTDYAGATVVDDLTGVLDDATYNGDASPATAVFDAATKKLTWTGDVVKGQTVTITYSVTVNKPVTGDKQLKNAVTGPDDSTCVDDCETVTPVAALEIRKVASKTTVRPGDKVTYTITVRNTGRAVYRGATVEDDLSGLLDDARFNSDQQPASAVFDASAKKLTWKGDVPAGQTVTITYSVTVNKPPAGDKVLRNAVTGPDDSTCVDDCATVTPVTDLRIKKTAAPQDPKNGDTVTYTVTVENTGGLALKDVTVTDDLRDVLDDSTWDDTARADLGGTDFDAAGPTLTWTGDLAVGAKATITYTVTVTGQGNKRLGNLVVGPEDSNCPPGSDDPDCRTVLPKPSLEIKKTAAPAGAVGPGDTVTYTLTVRNESTEADYKGARVVDDLAGVLDDAVFNNDQRPASVVFDPVSKKLTWTGDVAKGQTVTITYSVTVSKPPTGDRVLRNAVVGPTDSTCPPDSNDPSCSETTPIRTFRVEKTSDPVPGTRVEQGDKISYTVTVTNTGTAPYDDVELVDDISEVLDDAQWNDDATATAGTIRREGETVRWNGPLPVGGTVTLRYTVTVGAADPSEDAANGDLYNRVTSPTPGGNCVTGREDGCHTEQPITPQAQDALDVTKKATPARVAPGGRVTFTLTARNPSAQPMSSSVLITDDLTGVLDDARYDGDARATSGTVRYARPKLDWQVRLPARGTATLTYTVTVYDPPRGDQVLRNAATGPGTTCEVRPEECETVTPVRSLVLAKTSSRKTVKPGDAVVYTLTVTNTGKAPYTPATVTDDLTRVLADARYNRDVRATSGTARVSGNRLTWTGPLAPGARATITYSVKVNANAAGKRLVNAVTSTDPGARCKDRTPLPCSIGTEVVGGRLVLRKTDAGTGRPLRGAVFALLKDGRRVGASCATDRRGLCTFAGLAVGTYHLRELAVPEGYVLPRGRIFGPYRVTGKTTALDVRLTNRKGEPRKK